MRAERSPVHQLAQSREDGVSETIIRTENHLTTVEAHPYHRFISDDRPGGNPIGERAYDLRYPLCGAKS